MAESGRTPTNKEIEQSLFGAPIDAAELSALMTPPERTAATPTAGAIDPHTYDDMIAQHSAAHGVPPELVWAIIKNESSFNPNAVSPTGARGLGQFIRSTGRQYGVHDREDPEQSIRGTAAYLRDLLDRYKGDHLRAISAYNAGEGHVDRFGVTNPDYVRKVDADFRNVGAFTPYKAPDPHAGMTPMQLPNGEMYYLEPGETKEDALAFLQQHKPEVLRAPKGPEEPETSVLAAGEAGLKRGAGKQLRGAAELAERTDIPFLEQFAPGLRQKGQELEESAQRAYKPLTPEEMQGHPWEWVKGHILYPAAETGGEVLPSLIGAGMLGGAPGAAAGLTGMGLLSAGNISQATADKPLDNVDYAIHTAVDTALNYLKIPVAGPLKNIVLQDLTGPAKAAVIDAYRAGGPEAAQNLINGVVVSAAKGVATVGGANVVGGIGQEANIRQAQGLPLTGDEAMEAYKQAGIENFLGSIPFGVHQGMVAPAAQRAHVADIVEQERAREAPVRAPEPEAVPERAAPELAEPTLPPEEAELPAYVQQRLSAMEGLAPEQAPAVEPTAEAAGIAEPVKRAKEPAVIPEAPPARADVTQQLQEAQHYADMLGLRKTSAAYKALKTQYDINNPEHHANIRSIADALITDPNIKQKDVGALEALKNSLAPTTEAPSAQQIPQTSTPDGGGGPQPILRQKGRDQAIRSKGMEPSGQRVKTPKESLQGPQEVALPANRIMPERLRPEMPDTLKKLVTEHEAELAHHQALNSEWWETQKEIERYKPTGPSAAKVNVLKAHADALQSKIAESQSYLGSLEMAKPALEQAAIQRKGEMRKQKEAEAQAPKQAMESATPAESGLIWDAMRKDDEPAWADLERSTKDTWHSMVGKTTTNIKDPKIIAERDALVADAQDLSAFRREEIKRRKAEPAMPLYRRTEEAANPHTAETLQEALKKEGLDIPYAEISSREKEGGDKRTQGFYDPEAKKVVLIPENIDRTDNVRGLLRHEVAVHAHKLGKSDTEFKGILKQVENLRTKGVKDVVEAYKKVPEDTHPDHVHEEALARLVEDKPNLPVVKRFMSWLRRIAHKITGSDAWLRADDLRHMAEKTLITEARKTPTREAAEKLKAKAPIEVEELRARELTKTEAPKGRLESFGDEISAAVRSVFNPDQFRYNYIDELHYLSKALKDQPSFDVNGKMRADLLAGQQRMQDQFLREALSTGFIRVSDSGEFYVQPTKNNVFDILERASKLKGLGKDPTRAVADVLRVMVGEHWLKETERLRNTANNLTNKADRLEAHAKTQAKYEDRRADEQAAKALRKKADEINKRLGTEGLEKVVTKEDIEKANRLREQHPELEKLVNDVRENMRSLVDLHQKVGLIDAETAALWKSNPYIPLYMAEEDLAERVGLSPRGRSGGAKVMPKVHTLLGGKHAVNVFENLQKHTVMMGMAAFKNNIRRAAIDQLKPLGGAELLPFDERADKQGVLVRENGKDTYYRIKDPYVLTALEMAQPAMSAIPKMLLMPAKVLRHTVLTTNPAYWAKQILRDPLLANFTSRTKTINPASAAHEFQKIIRGNSPEYDVLRRHGIVGVVDPYAARELLAQGKAPSSRGIPEKAWDKIKHLHEAADAATRVLVYKNALTDARKQGFTGQKAEDFAVMRAREIINFSNRGRSQFVNTMRELTPFLGSALNGLDVLGRNLFGTNMSAKEAREARSLFVTRAAVLSALSMGLAYYWGDDKRYQSLSDRDRANNFIAGFTTVDGKERAIKIPIPPEIGFFTKTLPEMAVLNSMDFPYKDRFGKVAWEQFKDTVAPPVSMTLAPFTPIISAMANFDLHGGYNIESAGAKTQPVRERGRDEAPHVAVALSDAINKGAKAAIGKDVISPTMTDYLLNAYGTVLYKSMASASDYIHDKLHPEHARNLDRDFTKMVPQLATFLSNPDNPVEKSEFYEAMEAPKEVAAARRSARMRGDVSTGEYYANIDVGARGTAHLGEKLADRLAQIDTRIARIKHSDMSTEEKRTAIKNYNEMKQRVYERGAREGARYRQRVEEAEDSED